MKASQRHHRRVAVVGFTALGVLSALSGCETQSGAAIQVSFAPGSVDHLEFFFAQRGDEPMQRLRAIPQLAPTLKPEVLLRDYAANDSVTVTASDSSYVYFVPSSAAPKGDKVIVVGYLAGKPVSFDRETIVVSNAQVNEYVLELASPGATDGLADFGRDLYQCLAVKSGNEVDAVTRADDLDCDGIRTEIDKTATNATCDIDVLDRLASDPESCDGRDSGGDCVRFENQIDKPCAQRDAVGRFCRLGTSYACDDTSPDVAVGAVCDGVAPRSNEPNNMGSKICVDPLLCGNPNGPGIDLAQLVPAMECEVRFKPGDTKSCTKFSMVAIDANSLCPDADFIITSATTLKLQTRSSVGACAYEGEILDRVGNGDLVAVTLPVASRTNVRRLTMVRLKYLEDSNCLPEVQPCTAIAIGDVPQLANTCE